MSPAKTITEVRVGRPLKAPKLASKKSKPKKRGIARLKKELDRIFSLYIRAKYEKRCFTCGKVGVLQNGHFIVRKYLATRWDEDNCRPQCVGCNIYGKGMTADFEERLVQEIGAERVSQMKQKRKELWRLDEAWYLEKTAYYKALLEGVDNVSTNPKDGVQ